MGLVDLSSLSLLRCCTSVVGLPGEVRTPDPQLRRLLLYPTELRADCVVGPT